MALFVTATPPTPNGDLHLGHFSGPYLAADILARQARRRPGEVKLATGIDDHQSYTDLRALREGRKPEEVAESFGDRIERAWRDLGVQWDVVSRPRRSDHHRDLVEGFMTRLHAGGHVVARTKPLPWCENCQAWAYEAYVRGQCPHCGTGSCGNACEVCCRPNDCADLREPVCNRCDAPCELRDCERLYFPLEPHRQRLEQFWSSVRCHPHLTAVCREMAAQELPEIAVSHPGPWGIAVPVPGFESQTSYVWFEMAAGYLATSAECGGAWHGGEVVQCFGIDNGYFHAVLFPALMSAYDPALPLPDAFIGNEFYRLEGQKFSTSRKHAIWIHDGLERAHADHLRLYLCLDRPSATQTSFSWPQMSDRLYRGPLSRWAEWLDAAERRIGLLRRHGEGKPGSEAGRTLPTGREAVVTQLLQVLEEAYSVRDFSPRRAFQIVDMLATEGAEFGAEHEYLAGVPSCEDRFAAAVRHECRLLATFATALSPLAPAMAEQLWTALRLAGTAASSAWQTVAQPRWQEVCGLGSCPLFTPAGTP